MTWCYRMIEFLRYVPLNINIGRSDLRKFAWKFLQTCLGVPAVASFRKKMGKKMIFLRKRVWSLLAFLMACGRWGRVFATSANPSPCKKSGHATLSFTVWGGEYCTKMCNIRIDGARGICEGDYFRRLVSTKGAKTREIGPTFPGGLKQLEIRLHQKHFKRCIAFILFLCRFPSWAYARRRCRCCYLLVALHVRYLASGLWWIRWKPFLKRVQVNDGIYSTTKFHAVFVSQTELVQTSSMSLYEDMTSPFLFAWLLANCKIWEIWNSLDQVCSAEKRKEKAPEVRSRDGHEAHVSEISRSIS